MQYARASVAAIAAVMALSPTYAAPKPVVDLSQSPALSEENTTATAQPKKASNGPLDQQTMELGGGALVILAVGGAVLLMSNRRRRRERESWQYEEPVEPVAEAEPMALNEPIAREEPAMVAPPMSAFDHVDASRTEATGSDCEELETWTERAKCGPTPDNPSQSLKKRMKRAAFFEKRDREVAAGEAEPVDPDAGLPENLDESEIA